MPVMRIFIGKGDTTQNDFAFNSAQKYGVKVQLTFTVQKEQKPPTDIFLQPIKWGRHSLFWTQPHVRRMVRQLLYSKVIMSNKNIGMIWGIRTNVNPAFSKDGKRLYYNNAVSDRLSQIYRYNIPQ